jgi:hypothetical protein
MCVCNLESMLQLKQESNDKVFCWNWICMCVHAKIVWFCWIQRTNCGVGNELVFTTELYCRQRISFHCRIVLSAFTDELCCLQWISFHRRIVVSTANQVWLSNSVACSESVFAVKLCCLQRISVRYWNGVVCSELVFVAKIVLFAANQHSSSK